MCSQLSVFEYVNITGEPDLEEEHHSQSPTSSICTESSVGTRSSARIQNKRATPDKPYRNSPSLISTPQLARVTRGTAKLLESSLLEDEPADENEPSTSSGSRVKRKSSATGPQLISSPVVKKQRRLTLVSYCHAIFKNIFDIIFFRIPLLARLIVYKVKQL